MGLDALLWLMKCQSLANGCFRPVGSDGFWVREGSQRHLINNPSRQERLWGLVWKPLGRQGMGFGKPKPADLSIGTWDPALRLPVYDATTGGCRDGIHENRVNRNQGAESTLSFLMSLSELRSLSTPCLSNSL